jgi:solute:Na+ symporter, SSS family
MPCRAIPHLQSATLADSTLHAADWVVLASYFLLLIGIGIYFTRRGARHRSTSQRTARTDASAHTSPGSTSDSRPATPLDTPIDTTIDTKSYFLASSSMPVWVVAISLVATAQSAATVLGVPESAYKGDLRYISVNIGAVLAALILARFFIPAYYRLGVTTPYQLLEHRFGPGAKLAASWTYMLGRVLAGGARVYIGSIPVSLAVFGDTSPTNVAFAVAAFMIFGVLFTLAGGLSSAIWTDVVQVAVYLAAAALTIVVLWRGISAPADDILAAVTTGSPDGTSKLRVLSLGLDPSAAAFGFNISDEFTLLTALTGWTLLMLAAYGTDQDLVQRTLACKSARQGGWSVISGTIAGIPAILVFATIGVLLWVYYKCPQLTGRAEPDYLAGDTGEVFLKFALHEMPVGGAGLILAGVMAAGPAGINSSLNSMATTFVNDVYRHARPDRDDRHYVRVARVATAAWGFALGLFAALCGFWKSANREDILPFVLGIMTFAYAGLLAVFFTALFTKRGTTASAVAALLTGIAVIAAMQPAVLSFITSRDIADVTIASPWRLVIATIMATAVAISTRASPATR